MSADPERVPEQGSAGEGLTRPPVTKYSAADWGNVPRTPAKSGSAQEELIIAHKDLTDLQGDGHGGQVDEPKQAARLGEIVHRNGFRGVLGKIPVVGKLLARL